MSIEQAEARLAEERKKRRAQALRMVEAGKTLEEVGEALGVTRQRAHQLVERARTES